MSFIYKDKRILLISIFSLIIVRPHLITFIIFFLTVLLSLNLFLRLKGIFKKFFFTLFTLIVSIIFLNLIIIVANLDEISLGINIFRMIDQIFFIMEIMRNSYTNYNYAININSIPLRFLSYMFGPINIEHHNPIGILWMIENVFIILVVSSGLIQLKVQNIKYQINTKLCLLISILIALLFLSLTANNFGISMRQKWPYLSIFIFSIYFLNIDKENLFNRMNVKYNKNK